MCTVNTDASFNTGSISFSMYIYITDLTTKQYLYCKYRKAGNNMNPGFCSGLSRANEIFIEINRDNTVSSNNDIHVLTEAMNYQIGWNYFGCYSDGYK